MIVFYILICFVPSYVYSRDFYIGMFQKNDMLMAQDFLYKEKVPFGMSYAKYGRMFSCPITYIRVADRLGIAHGPRVEIIRGGLRNKAVVLRLTSVYNYPISVNIYIGCQNKIIATDSKKVSSQNQKGVGKTENKENDVGEKSKKEDKQEIKEKDSGEKPKEADKKEDKEKDSGDKPKETDKPADQGKDGGEKSKDAEKPEDKGKDSGEKSKDAEKPEDQGKDGGENPKDAEKPEDPENKKPED